METEPLKTNDYLVDSLATQETIALYNNLKIVADSSVLFGHQDATAYGIGWWGENDRSDVKEVCGDYPAVYGWDLGDIQNEDNLDGVNFQLMKSRISEAYERGGVITISMHLDNPVTGGNAWDNTPAVPSILPGKSWHNSYLQTLDKIVIFLKDLKSTTGSHIPVLFRPYHEHNHTWSWWGKSSCSIEEYNKLWQMTVEYLRDTKNIHHLLYVISPQEFSSETEYFERYPGDDYVDILGFDYYKLWDYNNIDDLGESLDRLATMAENRDKIAALTEIGVNNPYDNWWTVYLLAAINYSPQSKKTAWALVWRNQSESHHFAPYPDHRSANDFKIFYNNSFTLFESDLHQMYE